jgi:hypothetical protein
MKKMNELGGGKIAYKLPPSVLPPKYSRVESTPLKDIEGDNWASSRSD